MEVVVVQIPGTDLSQPGTVGTRRGAELFLDSGIDEDPLNLRIARGALDQPGVGAGPL